MYIYNTDIFHYVSNIISICILRLLMYTQPNICASGTYIFEVCILVCSPSILYVLFVLCNVATISMLLGVWYLYCSANRTWRELACATIANYYHYLSVEVVVSIWAKHLSRCSYDRFRSTSRQKYSHMCLKGGICIELTFTYVNHNGRFGDTINFKYSTHRSNFCLGHLKAIYTECPIHVEACKNY